MHGGSVKQLPDRPDLDHVKKQAKASSGRPAGPSLTIVDQGKGDPLHELA
jgi:hypothetical protein